MADGSGGEQQEEAKGDALNGGGKWFRIYVPSNNMQSTAHFGKPGPTYGYPGITFHTSSDLVAKTQHKIFLNSGTEMIATAGDQMTFFSKAAINAVGEGAVNVGSPGTVVVSALNSAAGQTYATVESGGDFVPTDRGHGAYVAKRKIFYDSIKSLQNWATAIDATVELTKTLLGYEVPGIYPRTLASLYDTLELVNSGFDTYKAWADALKDSPAANSAAATGAAAAGAAAGAAGGAAAGGGGAGGAAGGAAGGGAAGAGAAAGGGAPDYVNLDSPDSPHDELQKDIPGFVTKTAKYGKIATTAYTAAAGTQHKHVEAVSKIGKILGMVGQVAKLDQSIREVFFNQKAKETEGGRMVLLAEQEMFTGVGKKQVTVAAGGVEYWVPSLTDSFQVTAGGGVALKSMLKSEIFSVQAVSMEGMLGGTLVAGGNVQVASRKKNMEVFGPHIKIGSKKDKLPEHAKRINNFLQSGWNPMVQQPTKDITIETDPKGVIKIHIYDGDREIEMTDEHIKMFYKPSNSKLEMNKEGFTMVTDKKIFMKAQGGIFMKGDKCITGKSNEKVIWDVGNTTSIKLDTSEITTKQAGNSSVYGAGTHKLK